ncbi:MAG: anti-sigma factor antagonist [Clostridia bacterium]|nr:anti-sigma factor antagonist [Clostridia bacterium]MBQ6119383.1 anti-sigma factor antagonist [Clostridia bacterium]
MTITQDNGVLTAHLTGEIDHHSAAFMRSAVDAAFVRTSPKELVLDFSGVTFMDSSGVGLALGRYKKTREQNCTLVLAGLSERDKRMMKLSGMQKMEMVEFR